MTTNAAPEFDPNICIGFTSADEHPHPVADLRPSWLCPACDDKLTASLAPQPRYEATRRCPGGDHAPGSAYYTCLYCYGD